jgi:DNA-binding PucR family transcriptional regulator
VLALLDDISEANMAEVYAGSREADAFDAILAANRRYVARFAGGGGLNRALAQIVDALPEARVRWQAVNARVARRISAGIAKRAPDSAPHEDARVFAALALQAMLDTVLLQAFAYEFPELERLRADPERLSQMLSVLWYRALYGRSPRPEQVPRAVDLLTFTF